MLSSPPRLGQGWALEQWGTKPRKGKNCRLPLQAHTHTEQAGIQQGGSPWSLLLLHGAALHSWEGKGHKLQWAIRHSIPRRGRKAAVPSGTGGEGRGRQCMYLWGPGAIRSQQLCGGRAQVGKNSKICRHETTHCMGQEGPPTQAGNGMYKEGVGEGRQARQEWKVGRQGKAGMSVWWQWR